MSANALIDSLKSAKLLPSAIIPESFTPALDLSVKFSSGLAPEHGSLARVSQVKEQPIISLSSPPTSSAATYTFMMIDPDAPTPDDPKFGYWRHWVVAAIPSPSATTSPDDITTRGKTLTQYLAPGPKDESGPHRYLFLLFEESAGESLEKADAGGEEFVERRSFRAEELAAKKGLKLVGVQWMRGVGDGGKAVNENTDFCAVDAEPHKPTRSMVPAGRLQNHSRDLFLGTKANAHSSSGNIVASPLGMDLTAVQRGLQSAKRAPRYHMPLPNDKQRRDHLYSKLDTHPSLHGSERLLRESSVFSSTYSASDHTDTTQSPVALPPVVSANNWDPAISPRTASPTASHLRQQAPALAMDKLQKDIRSKGKKVNTSSVDRVGRSSHADTNPQSGYVINQRSITAQNVQKQHNGTALNLSNFNAQEQNQTFNLSHNAPSPTPSADEKHLGGSGTRCDQPD
ncbi:unnamed protein product [Alternaria alternata]